MTDQSTETKLAMMQQAIVNMEAHNVKTDAALVALRAERDSAMKWGVLTLGTAVLGMGSWIFTYITGHLK